jgi:nucleoid-associated protein YgaU
MLSRSLILTVGGLAAAAIVAAIAYWFLAVQPHGAPPVSVVIATFAPTPAPSAAAPSAAATTPAAQPSAAKPTTAAAPPPPTTTPAFDVVRVEPTGDAVVAGRAAPGARVDLSDDGKAIGDVVANDAGQFVILPPTFSPGRHSLRLSAKAGAGAPQVSDVVVVEVAATTAAVAAAPALTPSAAAAKPTPQPTVAAVATRTPTSSPAASATPTPAPTASAAASTPAPAVKPNPTPAAAIAVAVASVRPVDPAGLEAVGSAPPGAHVRLRLNNAVLAEVIAGADGAWRLTIERGVTAGDYVLEAAVVDAAGTVLARAESPFVYPQREAVASAAPTASPAASPAAVAPTPVASTPSASAASTPSAPAAASTPAAPSPAVAIAAAEPTPAVSAAAAPVAPAPAPSASVAAAPPAAAPVQTPATSETPSATAAHAVVPDVLTYSVVKGDNLWDLAVKYYGDGLRYADIFSANASLIHDPNLIYIGQIFVVPAKPTTNPSPAR